MTVREQQNHPQLIRAMQPKGQLCHFSIVAVDPGPGFGIATFNPHPAEPRMNFDTYTRNVQPDEGGHGYVGTILREQYSQMRNATLRATCQECCGEVRLVCEKFEFRKDDADQRDRIDFTAAEYVGVCKYVGDQIYDDVIMQGASEAKAFWSNDKLMQLGLYTPNQRHAMDALRHLLKYMTFTLYQKWLLEMLKHV